MANPFKIHMELEAEKKYSIKYVAISPAAPMQSAYISRKDLPNSIPTDIMVTIDFVDWEYILGHLVNNDNSHKK